jgi:transcriptional regulator with XRE-family HTH domain
MNPQLPMCVLSDPGYGGDWRKMLRKTAHNEVAETQQIGSSHSKFVHACNLGAVVALTVGTGGLFTPEYVSERDARGYRLQDFRYVAAFSATHRSKPQVRDPVANLARVREVFKPSVTELASLFGVSRQAIYNWQAGHPIAESNQDRLEQLAKASDRLEAEGFADKSSVLRRKLPGGATLFELVQAGESADTAVTTLITLINSELQQRQALSARLANRVRKPLDAVDIGSPYVNEWG